ncbi:Prostaglandin E2 receptor EP4 subtype [Bulinus truncatus]|nr:Prostaglandin E2 receptor EP4 subtype [Bulinus truncatus]
MKLWLQWSMKLWLQWSMKLWVTLEYEAVVTVEYEAVVTVKYEAVNVVKYEAVNVVNVVKYEAVNVVKYEAVVTVEYEAVNVVKYEAVNVVKYEAVNVVKYEAVNVVKYEAVNVVKYEAVNVVKYEAVNVVKYEAVNVVKYEAVATVEYEAVNVVKYEAVNVVKYEAVNVVKYEAVNVVKSSNCEYSEATNAKNHLSTAFYHLVKALAVMDLFGIVASSPVTFVVYMKGGVLNTGGMPLCHYFSFILNMAGNATVFVVLVMGIERFLVTKFPFKYSKIVTPFTVNVTIAVVWTGSVLFAILPIVGLGRNVERYPGTWCFFDDRSTDIGGQLLSYFYAIAGLLSIGITIVLNILVIQHLWRMRRSRLSSSVKSYTSSLNGSRKRFNYSMDSETRMVIFLMAIIVVFTVCYAPWMTPFYTGNCTMWGLLRERKIWFLVLNADCVVYFLSGRFCHDFPRLLPHLPRLLRLLPPLLLLLFPLLLLLLTPLLLLLLPLLLLRLPLLLLRLPLLLLRLPLLLLRLPLLLLRLHLLLPLLILLLLPLLLLLPPLRLLLPPLRLLLPPLLLLLRRLLLLLRPLRLDPSHLLLPLLRLLLLLPPLRLPPPPTLLLLLRLLILLFLLLLLRFLLLVLRLLQHFFRLFDLFFFLLLLLLEHFLPRSLDFLLCGRRLASRKSQLLMSAAVPRVIKWFFTALESSRSTLKPTTSCDMYRLSTRYFLIFPNGAPYSSPTILMALSSLATSLADFLGFCSALLAGLSLWDVLPALG